MGSFNQAGMDMMTSKINASNKTEFVGLRADMKTDLASLKAELKAEMKAQFDGPVYLDFKRYKTEVMQLKLENETLKRDLEQFREMEAEHTKLKHKCQLLLQD